MIFDVLPFNEVSMEWNYGLLLIAVIICIVVLFRFRNKETMLDHLGNQAADPRSYHGLEMSAYYLGLRGDILDSRHTSTLHSKSSVVDGGVAHDRLTSANGKAQLILFDNGILATVIGNEIIQQTEKTADGPCSLKLMPTGNIIVTDKNGSIVWAHGSMLDATVPNYITPVDEWRLSVSNTGSILMTRGNVVYEIMLPSLYKNATAPDIMQYEVDILWSSIDKMNHLDSVGRSTIYSPNGTKSLCLHENGNLTINDVTGAYPLRIHISGTDDIMLRHNLVGPYRLTLGKDGNLSLSQTGGKVVYQTGRLGEVDEINGYKARLNNSGEIEILHKGKLIKKTTLILHHL